MEHMEQRYATSVIGVTDEASKDAVSNIRAYGWYGQRRGWISLPARSR